MQILHTVGCPFRPHKVSQKRRVKNLGSLFVASVYSVWPLTLNVTPYREWAAWVHNLTKVIH